MRKYLFCFYFFLVILINGLYVYAAETQVFKVSSPGYVSLDPSDKFIYVSNGNNQILKMENFGKVVRKWQESDSLVNGKEILFSIDGITVTAENVYAINIFTKKVYKFNLDLSDLKNINCEDCKIPMGIAVNQYGKIFISDPGEGKVVAFKNDNEPELYFDFKKHPNTENLLPTKLNFDDKGFLYALDLKSSKMVKIDDSKRLLSIWGEKGNGDGQLLNPHGLAFDKDGNIFVSDTDNNRIVEFSKEGKFIKNIQSFNKGHEKLKKPLGLAIDKFNFIYIADSGNDRVIKTKCP